MKKAKIDEVLCVLEMMDLNDISVAKEVCAEYLERMPEDEKEIIPLLLMFSMGMYWQKNKQSIISETQHETTH